MRALTVLAVTFLTLAGPLRASESTAATWPSFRGPEQTGFAPGADPPLSWSETENVRWKVELDGVGHASPVAAGDRIYLMSARPKGDAAVSSGEDGERPTPTAVHEFAVSSHDLATGERVWRTVVREAVPHESLHTTASQVSGSPVTDGKRIWAFFGSRGLYGLDLDGKVLWEVDLGIQSTRREFGEGASPLVHDGLVVVNWDHEGDSFLTARDAETGEEVWRRGRDEPTSWSTPMRVRDGERDVVVVSAANAVRGYDLRTGNELWRAKGLGLNVIPTPVATEDVLWAMSGWREAYGMAIRYVGARGDLTGSDRIVWKAEQGLSYVPSPVLVEGRVYFFQRFAGILSCYDLETGEPCYDRQRIESFENVYASPVAAKDRIYAVSRSGEAVVLQAGAEHAVLARNELDDMFNATPAIVGDALILRGDRFLYRIEEAEASGGETGR